VGLPSTEVAPLFAIEAIQPNPMVDRTQIIFRAEAGGDLTLSIFDSSGRLVRALEQGASGTGRHAVSWDGRNALGENVSPGIYFVRLRQNDKVRESKFVVVR
jgi:flagellar hook assembly protein FlgD